MRRWLLACGMASSALYVFADLTSARRYDGYSLRAQNVSELVAAGAPTRRYIVGLMIPYNVLLLAGSAGIWLSQGPRKLLRLSGAMLAGSALAGTATMLVFPMTPRGTQGTWRNRLHPQMTVIGSLFILLSMWFGARVRGLAFRLFTYATMLTLVVFGAWTAKDSPRMESLEPTPWMGAKERVNIYAYLVWVAAIAAVLWRGNRRNEGT
jgi:uncharacterized protein DUF998